MDRSRRRSHRSGFILAVCLSLFFVSAQAIYAQTTHQSDYQFQLDRYRQNYASYQLYRQDYLSHQTLANEQKAVLAAKDSLVSRELLLANYYWLQADAITATKVEYPVVQQAIIDLNDLGQYHFDQSTQVTSIKTTADLTTYTKQNRKEVNDQQVKFARAQVSAKLALLIQYQTALKGAYDVILPFLDAQKNNLTVQNGLSQIQSYSSQANDLVSALADKITGLNLSESTIDQFNEKSLESLNQIRSLESRLSDLIIELDTNYVQR